MTVWFFSPAFSESCCALRRVSAEVVEVLGGFSCTPARRAFQRPIAIACLVERAPCLPSRMCSISSPTNSPAWSRRRPLQRLVNLESYPTAKSKADPLSEICRIRCDDQAPFRSSATNRLAWSSSTRSAEKFPVHRGIHSHWICIDEVLEVVLGGKTLFDEFVGLFSNAPHVGHIPVAEVGFRTGPSKPDPARDTPGCRS